jgi:hypothetical protein
MCGKLQIEIKPCNFPPDLNEDRLMPHPSPFGRQAFPVLRWLAKGMPHHIRPDVQAINTFHHHYSLTAAFGINGVDVFVGIADEIENLVDHLYDDTFTVKAFLVLYAGQVVVASHAKIEVVTIGVQGNQTVGKLLVYQAAKIGICEKLMFHGGSV